MYSEVSGPDKTAVGNPWPQFFWCSPTCIFTPEAHWRETGKRVEQCSYVEFMFWEGSVASHKLSSGLSFASMSTKEPQTLRMPHSLSGNTPPQKLQNIFLAGTGYGRSLIFEGMTILGGKKKVVIVVCPLKVNQARKKAVDAILINEDNTKSCGRILNFARRLPPFSLMKLIKRSFNFYYDASRDSFNYSEETELFKSPQDSIEVIKVIIGGGEEDTPQGRLIGLLIRLDLIGGTVHWGGLGT
ncbi:hypothetical protein C8R44DRAFT_743038 [Mycena epipterygia]|nr:hypothetical protein C8R44DRAFT_743038 [Mycena epipterygia]